MKSVAFIGSIARAAGLCAALMVNAHAGPGDWSGQGGIGGSILALQADPLVPTRVYASTTNGFFRSDDAGVSWAAAETGLLVAHPANSGFAVSPNSAGGLWMFDDAGRLYGSSNAGNNWIPTGYTTATAPTSSTTSLAQGTGSTVWYAADAAGLLVSNNNGVTFAAAGGVGFPSGQTFTLVATNPHNTQQVIASSASSCNALTGICPVYISSNGGANWSASLFSGVASVAGGAQRITAIAFGPGTNVYALYGDANLAGTFLLSSNNNGANWTAHAQAGSAVAASPVDPLTVWVDASKSTNGGGLFTPLATTGRNTNGTLVPGTSAIAVSPSYPGTPRLWIGTFYAGMYLSNNDGATWTSSNDGMAATDIRSVIVHPADNTRLFAGYGDSIGNPSQAFYRSTSSGTWNVSNAGLNAWQLRTVMIDPTTAGTIGSTVIYAVGSGFDTSLPASANRNSGIYKSLDGGLTWATQNGGIPPSPLPAGPGHFAGNLRTIIADPRSCVSPPLDGSACTTGPLRTLYVTGGGRPGIDPAPPGTGTHLVPRLYRVMKSTDGGANWADSSTGLPQDVISDLDCTFDSVEGVTPIVMDPTNSNILYIGTFADATDAACNVVTTQIASGVYKSVDAGAHWTIASTGLPTYTGSPAVLNTLSLAIDAASPGTLWVSTVSKDFNVPGEIYKTTNGGGLWSVSNAGVSGPDVRALLADPSNPGTIYAASGGLGPANPGGVYKSTDGGANWMSISVGLPSFSATALTLDPVDPTVLYAGTTGGVYSIVQLPDDDADGVPDLVENSGPNGGDANNDASQDSIQHNVGTTAPGLFGGFGWQPGIENATPAARTAQLQQKLQLLKTPQTSSGGIQGGYFTVQVNGGCAQAVDVAPINPGPLGLDQVKHHGTYTYPRGLLRFELPQCASANVDIIFNAATFGAGWSWRYYGPSVPGDNSTMGWYNASSIVASQVGNDWKINLAAGAFGSYRPLGTNSILFEGGPAYNDTVFSDNFQ